MSKDPTMNARNGWVNRFILPILLVLGIGCVIASLTLPLPFVSAKKETEEEPLFVPAFTQTERNGQTVTNEDLKGKVWIAAFVFTRCAGPCPSVTATMAKLQKDLKLSDRDELRLVSFTIDPDRDSQAELQKYADRFQAHPTRWLFLSGPEETQQKLATTGFKILANRSSEADPKPGMEFDHSTKLALIDKKGVIRGYYDGFQGQHDETGERFNRSYAALLNSVETLLNE